MNRNSGNNHSNNNDFNCNNNVQNTVEDQTFGVPNSVIQEYFSLKKSCDKENWRISYALIMKINGATQLDMCKLLKCGHSTAFRAFNNIRIWSNKSTSLTTTKSPCII